MNDEDLLGYFEIHSRTERALFHRDHVARLLKLAGENSTLGHVAEFIAVGYEMSDPLVARARTRLKIAALEAEIQEARYMLIAGFVPEDLRAEGIRMPLKDLAFQAFDHHEYHHEEAGAPRERIRRVENENTKLRADLAEALNALQWCSGANDFQEGGQAAEGYDKIVRPLAARLRAFLGLNRNHQLRRVGATP